MSEFNAQLGRLMLALGVSQEQEVAELLGMSKQALADRKRRDSFPNDKLKALAGDRPDLRLDVKYILTGVSDELERRLSALKNATAIASKVAEPKARAYIQTAAFEMAVNALSPDEQQLVHCFRRADTKGQALLLATAVTLGGTDAATPRKKGTK